MTETELVIKEGEGQFVEFKRSLGDIAPEITAFANASGGRIYIGIDDDGKVPGITTGNAIKSQTDNYFYITFRPSGEYAQLAGVTPQLPVLS